MERLRPALQSYPWGSRTKLAQLTGAPVPTNKPWAELWFGAHPLASSLVGDRPLSEIIAQDPESALGKAADVAGGTLPFLLKLLAADEPLSLQAHPTLDQAKEGFERENAEGIPTNAPHRNYRDANHKPELIVALTEFHALAGFRPVARTKALFEALQIDSLNHYLGLLDGDSAENGLRALFTTWLTLPQQVLDSLVADVSAGCAAYSGDDYNVSLVAETTAALAKRYPGDPGVLGSMLLNRLVLRPGEALYLGAGQLHAYLSGVGVEIMANSDNVLRGGLTSKHVDVVELLKVLTFEPLGNPIVGSTVDESGWVRYETPASEFALASIELLPGQQAELPAGQAAIVLSAKGDVKLSSGSGSSISVEQGSGAWIDAAEQGSRMVENTSPETVKVFVATVPVAVAAH